MVEEHEQAVALVLLEQLVLARGVVDELVDREHRRDCRDSQRQRDEQVLRTRTACNKRHRADCKIHKARAQVGLRHDGQERHQDEENDFQVFSQVIEAAAIACNERRIHEDDRDLRELARLHLDAELQPRLGAHAGIGADAGDMRGQDERDVQDEQRHDRVREPLVVHPPHEHHDDSAHRSEDKLAREAVGRVVRPLDGRPAYKQAVPHKQHDNRNEGEVYQGEPPPARARCTRKRRVGRLQAVYLRQCHAIPPRFPSRNGLRSWC